MTGSKIVSVLGGDGNCHPVAVFPAQVASGYAGAMAVNLCTNKVFRNRHQGTRYLTYHTINNTNTDILETNRNYYRVCVSDPAAVVKEMEWFLQV